MHTKYNGDHAKVRIISFITERQRKQPNAMKESIRIFM